MNKINGTILITIIGFIIIISMLLWIFFIVVPESKKMDEEIEYLKSLGWEPENSIVEYSYWHTEDNTDLWKNFWVWIEFEDAPWNNTNGHIWYNHNGVYYFEEDLD